MPAKSSASTKATDNFLSVKQLIILVGKFVGIVGGSGAGLAALSFGIGYLAIKSHDAMLGLPTTTSTYESYVRTGSLFFPNSLYFLITTVSEHIWEIAVPSMILVIVISLALSKRSLKSVAKHILVILMVVYAVINLFALLSTKRLASVLHPENKGLLLKLPADVKHTGYERQIYNLLRKEGGTSELQKVYSLHLGATIVFICTAIALSKLRPRKESDSKEAAGSEEQSNQQIYIFVCDWLFRPLLYALIVFHLVLLPTNYGVLCISNEYPHVSLVLKEGEPVQKMGFLLSDMSVEQKEIIWLSRQAKGQLYSHHFYQRNNIKIIKTISNPGLRNILAVEGSDGTPNR